MRPSLQLADSSIPIPVELECDLATHEKIEQWNALLNFEIPKAKKSKQKKNHRKKAAMKPKK